MTHLIARTFFGVFFSALLTLGCGESTDVAADGTDEIAVEARANALTSGGYYVLANKLSNLCLGGDATAPAGQPCRAGWTSQKLQLNLVESPYWQIKHPYSGKCLGDNLSVLEWEPCNATWWSQMWEAVQWGAAGAEHFVMRNRYSGKSLASSFSNSLYRETLNTSYWSQAWELLPYGMTDVSANPYIDRKCIVRYTSKDNSQRAFVYPVGECSDPWGYGFINYDAAESADVATFAPRLPLHFGTSGTEWGPVLNYGLTANGNNWISTLGTNYYDSKADERHLYNWFSLSDQLPSQVIGDSKYYVDFEIRFLGATNASAPTHNAGYDATPRYHTATEQGKSRITLGIHGRYNNTKDIWLEWVLWNSSGDYDGCQSTGYDRGSWWGPPPTSPCDPSGNRYDRRSFYGDGETKYFSPTGLSTLPAIAPMPVLSSAYSSAGTTRTYPSSTTWYAVRLPITKLFKNDSNGWHWLKDYKLLKMDQVYLGVESHGKVKTKVEVRNWRVYKVGP